MTESVYQHSSTLPQGYSAVFVVSHIACSFRSRPGERTIHADTRSRDRVVERMLRRLLSGSLVSTAPRANDDEHAKSSRSRLSSFTSTRLYLTTSPLSFSRRNTSTQPAITDDDNRAPSQSSQPNMAARLAHDESNTDPTIASTWSLQKDAKLNREYTLVDNDDPDEQGYDVIPDVKTTLVEKNPKRPPHPLDHYANNRSYIRKLAERMDYWVSDPAARLRGGKQRKSGERSDKDRAIDDAAWVSSIKADIRCLWDNMGVGQDLLIDELQDLKIAFFYECRKTLEQIEEEGQNISFARVQDEIRNMLILHDLKLSGEGIKIMKEMATDKQALLNCHDFSFEEQRQISKLVVQTIGRLSRWEHFVLRKRLLAEMPSEQREICVRRNLDIVRRYFSHRAMESFAKGKKMLMEQELMGLQAEEKERSRKLKVEELERQQKHLEEQVEFLVEILERRGY